MRRFNYSKTLLGGVAAILIAAAFLLATAGVGDAASEGSTANEPAIDTGAPIDPSQCTPCHADLGDVNQPGLIFTHGNHLLVSCDGCHSRMPHRDGATEKVPMEVCFACHGVQHGPQGELASSQCRDCHTSSFKLRPSSHTKDWSKKPHADLSKKTGVNDCMMCHDAPKDCDRCHEKQGVDVGKMPNVYHSLITKRPKGPSIKIYPKGKVSMSQCVYCHDDLDAITPGRLIFAHAAHLQRNFSCTSCHNNFAHTENGVTKPDMQSCYRCHGVYHKGAKPVAEGQDCYKCHPKSFQLRPSDHTPKFIAGDHAKRQAQDPSYCSMCHASQFCVDCHTAKSKSPNAPSKPVIPKDHKDAKWAGTHGGLFLAGQGACGACHAGPSCQRCHQTVLPHPAGWIKDHKPRGGITVQDCNICHRDRQACQECHHSKLKNAYLVAKACTPCHEEAKQKPATSIKSKGIAEHAVHFNVAKKKGKPYKCYECHVNFGTSEAAQKAALQQGHDLRLCYGCHGNLDPFNQLIAPYKGAELCLRCHQNLNI